MSIVFETILPFTRPPRHSLSLSLPSPSARLSSRGTQSISTLGTAIASLVATPPFPALTHPSLDTAFLLNPVYPPRLPRPPRPPRRPPFFPLPRDSLFLPFSPQLASGCTHKPPQVSSPTLPFIAFLPTRPTCVIPLTSSAPLSPIMSSSVPLVQPMDLSRWHQPYSAQIQIQTSHTRFRHDGDVDPSPPPQPETPERRAPTYAAEPSGGYLASPPGYAAPAYHEDFYPADAYARVPEAYPYDQPCGWSGVTGEHAKVRRHVWYGPSCPEGSSLVAE